ncbi:hypothetical protein WEU32_07710 [Brevundimonas sp. BH3]|uniref:hypothetical protein n=1 Tax=Brevundimonas sp. BH3 TaxID=3133089 RepID=UPI00324657A5
MVTTATLEALLVQRGSALLACDAARQLAVDTLIGQQSDLKALGQTITPSSSSRPRRLW